MRNTWVTSDTHLGHTNIIDYCGRPVDYEDKIYNGLKHIKKDDTLIHLGDVCMGNDAKHNQKFTSAVAGKKILIRGNHDHKCHSYDTKLLTVHGFKNFWQLKEGMLIPTYRFNKHRIEMHPISRIHIYNKRLKKLIRFKNEHVNALVTFDHMLIYTDELHGPYKEARAIDLYNKKEPFYLLSAPIRRTFRPLSCRTKKNKERHLGPEYLALYFKSEYYDESYGPIMKSLDEYDAILLDKMANKLGLNHMVFRDSNNYFFAFKLKRYSIMYRLIRTFGYKKALCHLAREYIFSSHKLRRALSKVNTDGLTTIAREPRFRFIMDRVSAYKAFTFFNLTGITSAIYKDGKHLIFRALNRKSLRPIGAKNKSIVETNREVWGVSVQNSITFTARKGKMLFSRNSDQWYLDNGWDFVCNQLVKKYYGKRVSFSHKPVSGDGFDISLFGHFHNNDLNKCEPELINKIDNRGKLIALEHHNYRPYSLQSLITKFKPTNVEKKV